MYKLQYLGDHRWKENKEVWKDIKHQYTTERNLEKNFFFSLQKSKHLAMSFPIISVPFHFKRILSKTFWSYLKV